MSYSYGTGANANYSGRVLVYPDQVPFDTDVLRSNQYRMVDIANLAQAVIGLPPAIAGSFASYASGICTQNSAPNMTVQIGLCTIWQQAEMEPNTYGSIPVLTTPLLFKQFTNMLAFNSSTLAGGTFANAGAGNWKYYLIQGTPQTAGINSVNRPYYNAADPNTPNFNPANDTYIDRIVFTVVAGAESVKSGALPALPTVSGGAVGMFLVLVDDVVASITNSLISFYPNSFISTTLPLIPTAIQNQNFSYGVDTGTANALAVSLNPIVGSYTAGMRVSVLAAHNNTGATTLNVNGVAVKAVTTADIEALVGGEILAGGIYDYEYDGTQWQIINPSGVGSVTISSNIPVVSSVSVNGTTTDVTTISIPAGRWRIFGNVTFTGTTVVNGTYSCWINNASVSPPDSSMQNAQIVIGTGTYVVGMNVPFYEITVPTPTTIYLTANNANGGASAVTACGSMFATRA